MEYTKENPNVTEKDFYDNGFGYILHFHCKSDPKYARRWCRRFIRTLEKNIDAQYSLSAFMYFIVNIQDQRTWSWTEDSPC